MLAKAIVSSKLLSDKLGHKIGEIGVHVVSHIACSISIGHLYIDINIYNKDGLLIGKDCTVGCENRGESRIDITGKQLIRLRSIVALLDEQPISLKINDESTPWITIEAVI